jgi:hypothetical protein
MSRTFGTFGTLERSTGEGSSMAELLKLRQAARLIGVSPGRLYRAITDGRLVAAPGGGPGKPTLVSLEAVQAFCQHEGLRVPGGDEAIERSEHAERSGRSERAERSMNLREEALTRQALETMAGQYLAQVMARQSDYFEAFLRDELSHLVERVAERVADQVVERVTERLERAERPERSMERSTLPPAISPPNKADILARVRTLRDAGLSLQQIADLFNTEGVPTLSGKGRWQKGTIGKLLAEGK